MTIEDHIKAETLGRWVVISLAILVTVLMIYFLVTKPTVWDKIRSLEYRVQELESRQK